MRVLDESSAIGKLAHYPNSYSYYVSPLRLTSMTRFTRSRSPIESSATENSAR